jgi:hypothetical protein
MRELRAAARAAGIPNIPVGEEIADREALERYVPIPFSEIKLSMLAFDFYWELSLLSSRCRNHLLYLPGLAIIIAGLSSPTID